MTMNLRQYSEEHLSKSLSILSKWIIPRLQVSFEQQQLYIKCAIYWCDKLQSYIDNYKIIHASKRAKVIRAITLSYLSGNPVKVVKEFISINKKGLPGDLGPLETLAVSKDKTDRKFLLTLLCISKGFTAESKPDISPITTPSTGVVVGWDQFINRFFRFMKIRKGSLSSDFSHYHLSTKTSPNGDTALSASLKEVLFLKNNMSLSEAIFTLGGPALKDRILALWHHLKLTPCWVPLRRISVISDKECKARVVAIFDYWSQTALRPLHNSLLKLLRSLKSDMTFNQDGFHKNLKSGPYYSFDLKDATDRFPIALQQQVLSYLIGEAKAKAWAVILIQEPFSSRELGGQTYYRCGQPMGAYSSWATFALSHHLVVQRAAMETNKFPFNKYALLGDDIVICDHAVAIRYKELMLELGVTFSPTKTFISQNMFEFASRVFIDNEEISPFSLVGLKEAIKHPATTTEFLRTMEAHGWNLLKEGNIPGQIRSLMRLLGSPAFKRWGELIDVFYHIPLRVLLKNDNGPEVRRFLKYTPCFESHHIPLLRDAVILELRSKVEERIDAITELHTGWALALPSLSDYIRSDAGDIPISPATIPLTGIWFDLKRQARELANEISDYYYELDQDIPLDKWISDLTYMSNTPDLKQVQKGRKHKEIILTTSSLIIKAVKRLNNKGLEVEE
jgi:hypothetical protein